MHMSWGELFAGLTFGLLVLSAVVAFLARHWRDSVHLILSGMIDQLRTETIAPMAKEIADLRVDFAKETGGNSNGLRQAVNEVLRTVSDRGEVLGEIQGRLAALERRDAA